MQTENRLFDVDTTNAVVVKDKQYKIPAYKVMLVKEGNAVIAKQKIGSPLDVVDMMQDYLEGVDRENFVIAMLDTKNNVIGVNTVSIGSLNSSIVHPREVFKAALLAGAASIILCHNHPSGDPEPSKEDIQVTNRLVKAGEIIGIEVLDHIILGDRTYKSLKEMCVIA